MSRFVSAQTVADSMQTVEYHVCQDPVGILVSKKILMAGMKTFMHKKVDIDVLDSVRHKEKRNNGDCISARGH